MEATSDGVTVPSSVEKPRRKRTLDDKACEVCDDKSTGKHYGVYVCDGCSGFFKRTVRRSIPWVCRNDGKCIVDRASRTDCRACRFKKCLLVNMNPEGVQPPHGSRVARESISTNSEGDSNYAFPMSRSPDFNQPENVVQANEDDPRANSSTSSVSSISTSNSSLPVSRPGSPLISMATSGGSGAEYEYRTDSPVLVKVETQGCDLFEADKNLEMVGNHSESKRKEAAVSSPASGQSTCTQTGLVTMSQPVTPVVTFTPRKSQQTQLVPTQMLVVPSTSFTHHYPCQSSRFPSPRRDRANRSPGTMEISLPPGPKDSIHSFAVQLLSNSVQFAKNIPSFKSLAFRDQVILLEESWKDIFILDASFCSFPLEISYILPPGEATKEANVPLVSSLRVLQELVTRIQALELDESECGYLKTVVIFKPDIKGLKDSHQIENLQDEAQVKLAQYTRTTRVTNPARFGRLLLTLLAFERVSQDMIEKLFFRAQNYSVEYILHDIFKKT